MSPGFDYHASGAVNAVFFALALFGLFSQWRKILVRRVSAAGRAQGPTAILSLNQFAVPGATCLRTGKQSRQPCAQ